MSEANVELARRAYDAIRRRDIPAILDVLHPEVEVRTRLETHRGHAAVRRWFEEAFDAHLTLEPMEFIDAGDQVVVFLRFGLVGAHTGIESEHELAETLTVRNGKIACVAVSEKDEALAGLERPDRRRIGTASTSNALERSE